MLKPLHLGPIRVDVPVVLAPMAGVTDAAYRTVCREHAPGLLYVGEMVTARALVEGNAKTLTMLPQTWEPRPRSVQLYGTAPGTMYEAVRRLVTEHGVDHVDMNFGCPVPKVTRKGGGAALPVRRRLLAAIIGAAVRAAEPAGVPVTVKFRIGIDDATRTHLQTGRIAEGEGAAAVALHARTAEQRYAGHADWDAIGELKVAVTTIPVLGNGDIWEATDALAMVAATGCDGVVVGRGCLGRPWLFADLVAAFRGEPIEEHRPFAVAAAALRRHADLLIDLVGEHAAVRALRKHAIWYVQGYPVGFEVRRRLGTMASRAELEEILAPVDPAIPLPEEARRMRRGHTDGPRPVALPEGWLDLVDDPTPPVGAEVLVSGG